MTPLTPTLSPRSCFTAGFREEGGEGVSTRTTRNSLRDDPLTPTLSPRSCFTAGFP
jgi:hypothetical protein